MCRGMRLSRVCLCMEPAPCVAKRGPGLRRYYLKGIWGGTGGAPGGSDPPSRLTPSSGVHAIQPFWHLLRMVLMILRSALWHMTVHCKRSQREEPETCQLGFWSVRTESNRSFAWSHSRRGTASSKARAKASGGKSCEDSEAAREGSEASAQPSASGRGGGRKKAPAQKKTASRKKADPATSAPDTGGSEHVDRLLQGNRLAHVASDSGTAGRPSAGSAAPRATKPRVRRKAPPKAAAPAAEAKEKKAQGRRAAGSVSKRRFKSSAVLLSSSKGVSEIAGTASCRSKGLSFPSPGSLTGGQDGDNQLSPIMEECTWEVESPQNLSSPAVEVVALGGERLCEQSLAAPEEDAWCYIASSPELSPLAPAQQTACLSTPRPSHDGVLRSSIGRSREALLHSSGAEQVCASSLHA